MSSDCDAPSHAATTRHPAIECVLWLVWRVHSTVTYLAGETVATINAADQLARSRVGGPYLTLIAVVLLLSLIPAIVGH